MRNNFLEKSYAKCGSETSPRPFSEKFKLTKSLDQWYEVFYNFILLYDKLRAISTYRN